VLRLNPTVQLTLLTTNTLKSQQVNLAKSISAVSDRADRDSCCWLACYRSHHQQPTQFDSSQKNRRWETTDAAIVVVTGLPLVCLPMFCSLFHALLTIVDRPSTCWEGSAICGRSEVDIFVGCSISSRCEWATMPTITLANDERNRAQPISREDSQIAASTCLTRCLYNIPPGAITATLSGLSILFVGVVLIGLTASNQSNFADGLFLAVVTVAVGGGWTLMAVGFWVAMCCRYRLRSSSKTTTKQNTSGSKSSVELVAVSWRDEALNSYGFQNTSLDRIHYYNCATWIELTALNVTVLWSFLTVLAYRSRAWTLEAVFKSLYVLITRTTLCSKKKHVTTFSMISWSRIIRLQRFLAHLLPRV